MIPAVGEPVIRSDRLLQANQQFFHRISVFPDGAGIRLDAGVGSRSERRASAETE